MDNIRKVSRGQVWFLVDPKADDYDGFIQGKNRPVLVVSNNICNQTSPVVHIAPLTTANKMHIPTHVHFNDGKFDQTILCEQCRPVKESLFYDKSYYKYTLSDDLMQKVDEALAIQFGLSLLMPNSERFWKSVESMIRLKVKETMNSAKVSAIDISKVSTLLKDVVDSEISVQSEDTGTFNPPIKEEPAPVKVTEKSVETKKSKKNNWTTELKREFVDNYYKYGAEKCATIYEIKIGSAYRLKWQFEQELKNA